MGQSSSKNSVTIDTSTALSSLTKNLQDNKASTLNSVAANQDFTLNISGSVIKNSTITLGQKIDTSTNTDGSLQSGALTTINADMKAKLNDAIDQAAKANSGFLATGSAQSQNVTNVKSNVSVAIDSITDSKNYSKLVSETVDTQSGTINIKNSRFDGSTLTYDQTIVAKSIAANMLKTVLDSASNAMSTTDQQVSLTQKSDSTTSGIDSLLGSLASLYGIYGVAAGGTSLLCCCCCCCLICLSIIMAMQKPSNGSS